MPTFDEWIGPHLTFVVNHDQGAKVIYFFLGLCSTQITALSPCQSCPTPQTSVPVDRVYSRWIHRHFPPIHLTPLGQDLEAMTFPYLNSLSEIKLPS